MSGHVICQFYFTLVHLVTTYYSVVTTIIISYNIKKKFKVGKPNPLINLGVFNQSFVDYFGIR